MKSLCLGTLLFLGLGLLVPSYVVPAGETATKEELNNINAFQAMAVANKWRSSNKTVKSYVTPREVVFQFPDGSAKKIPLPEEKMVVAFAPYISHTHT